MRIVKIKTHLSIGYANANREDELELQVDDDATPEEIEKDAEQLVNDWSTNYIDLGFQIIE